MNNESDRERPPDDQQPPSSAELRDHAASPILGRQPTQPAGNAGIGCLSGNKEQTRTGFVPIDFMQNMMQEMMSKLIQTTATAFSAATAKPTPRIRNLEHIYVPAFDPDDRTDTIQIWCRNVDDIKTEFDLTERETLNLSRKHLKGRAAEWARRNYASLTTWPELKDRLIETFADEARYYDDLVLFMDYTSDQASSLAEYATRKWELAKKAVGVAVTEERLVEAVISASPTTGKSDRRCRLRRWCRSRRCQLWRLLLLPFIPILALIVQTTLSLRNSVTNGREVSDVEEQVSRATELGKLVTRLQQERSEVAFFIFTNGNTLRSNLSMRFTMTDNALLQMGDLPPLVFKNRSRPINEETFRAELEELRLNILAEKSMNMTDAVEWYTNANAALLNHLTKEIKDTDSSTIWRYLVGFKNILRSIECKGIASVLGIHYFGRGTLQPRAHERFIAHMILGRDLLDNTLNLVPSLIPLHKDIKEDSPEYKELEKKNQRIVDNNQQTGNLSEAISYFDQTTTLLDKLRAVQKQLREYIREGVTESLTEARRSEAVCAGILILVCVVSPIIIALVRTAVNTIQVYATNLAEKARELEYEKELSDSLLYQMLPATVAKQLKQTQQVPAEFFASVTVYFSDIVGFTAIAAVSTPYQVISFLNSVYKLFDDRIECYDVYKIETIGDSYMVASGLPIRNGNKHATEIASMALELLAATTHCRLPHRPDQTLCMRSGIHTGPCVAGIVGSKMPRYCLFGDTINTASRMESTSEPMKIQISDDVKRALDRSGRFITTPRGVVDVKGKGEMMTHWLEGRTGPSPVRPASGLDCSAPSFLARIHSQRGRTESRYQDSRPH